MLFVVLLFLSGLLSLSPSHCLCSGYTSRDFVYFFLALDTRENRKTMIYSTLSCSFVATFNVLVFKHNNFHKHPRESASSKEIEKEALPPNAPHCRRQAGQLKVEKAKQVVSKTFRYLICWIRALYGCCVQELCLLLEEVPPAPASQPA